MSLTPDLILDTFDMLTVSFLQQKGIKALILDVDNTLIPYEETKPRPGVLAWLAQLKEAGISVAFVSNNHAPRLSEFNAELGYPAYANSCKPFRKNMKKALLAMGVQASEAANVGDQIFTDVWSAKRLGLFAILVKPIKDKTTLFNRSKRALEKPILRRYRKKHGDGVK